MMTENREEATEQRQETEGHDAPAYAAPSDPGREPRPQEILRETAGNLGEPGDAADQGERLRLLMEAEAVDEARAGRTWDPSLEGVPYPLEDVEDVLAMEGAEDSSDDALHAGGLAPNRWVPAEEAAMHIVDPQRPDELTYLDSPTNSERANTGRDDFEGLISMLTPEDETLLGVDPYDEEDSQGSTPA